MSRKKVKKEVVKRKTNIYDPMGVYGRGLTENQRLGMTRQMKIENMRDQKKVITKRDLEEYQKILEFYGMYPVIPTGTNIVKKIYEVPFSGYNANITNLDVINYLESQGITPGVFYCDSFAIVKDHSIDQWETDIRYYIGVGVSSFASLPRESLSPSDYVNDVIQVPAYWMNLGEIHYFQIVFDSTNTSAKMEQKSEDLSGQQAYFNFVNYLPQDGTEIPFLMYPNNSLPELFFGVSTITEIESGYKLQVNLTVMY